MFKNDPIWTKFDLSNIVSKLWDTQLRFKFSKGGNALEGLYIPCNPTHFLLAKGSSVFSAFVALVYFSLLFYTNFGHELKAKAIIIWAHQHFFPYGMMPQNKNFNLY